MTSSTATLIGFTAILMWSLLSLLTVASGTVPPFQLRRILQKVQAEILKKNLQTF